MKVVLDRGILQRRLKVIERIVPKRGGLPQHYVVNVFTDEEGVVELWAANQRESYQARLVHLGETELEEAIDFEDGAVVIPAQEFIKAVAAAPNDEVWITSEVGSGSSRIESGTARWNIESVAGVEPTNLGELAVQTEGEMNQLEMVKLLKTLRYAASKSESRPSFMQVHFGEHRAVAADGRRLHQEGTGPVGNPPTFDLPERSVDTLLEALEAERVTGQLQIGVTDDGTMRFSFGTMTYYVSRLNYHFPDIDALALNDAREQVAAVVCSRDALVTAVKVAAVSIDEGGVVLLRITAGVVEVQGHSQRSEGRMEVRATTANFPGAVELAVVADDLLELLGRVYVEGDGDFTFTVSVTDDPGWLFVGEGGMEAAIRPVTA